MISERTRSTRSGLCYKVDCPSSVYYVENAPVARKTDLIYFTMPSSLLPSPCLSGEIRVSSYPPGDRFQPRLSTCRDPTIARKPVINEYGFHWGIWFVLFPRRVTRFRGCPVAGNHRPLRLLLARGNSTHEHLKSEQ